MDHSKLKSIAEKNRSILLQFIKEKLKILGFDQNNLENPKDLNESEKETRNFLLSKINLKDYQTSIKTFTEELSVYWFNLINLIFFLIQKDVINVNSLFNLLIDLRMNEISASVNEFPPRRTTLLKLEQYKINFINGLTELSKKLPFLSDDYLKLADFLFLPEDFSCSGVFSEVLLNIINSSLNENEYPQVLGWLYQYFNKDRKDDIFRDLKRNKKISKDTLASATLIYTPDWIVKYMVENTLGRLWINHLILMDGRLSEEEYANQFGFKYYLTEDVILSQEEEDYYRNLRLEDIKFLDPAMGSGNILLYAFDVFLQFYRAQDISFSESVKNIVNNNLFGFDIDQQALKLSSASLLLKTDKFSKDFSFNLKVFEDFNLLTVKHLKSLKSSMSDFEISCAIFEISHLLKQFENSKLLGSLLKPEVGDLKLIEYFLSSCRQFLENDQKVLNQLATLIDLTKFLTQKYDVVVTNPPYFGSRYLNKSLQKYLQDHYLYKHKDLFSAFIEKDIDFTNKFGFMSMIIQPSFLSLQSLRNLRTGIIKNNSILSLLDIGRGVFGADFGSCVFVIRKGGKEDYTGKYFKLHERIFIFLKLNDIEQLFLNAKNNPKFKYNFSAYEHKKEDNKISISNPAGEQIYYEKNQSSFLSQPKSTMVYWISDNLSNHFKNCQKIIDIAEIKQGLATTNNNEFLRYWYEVDFNRIYFNAHDLNEAISSGYKWFPYNKGGAYRKWYGNDEYVINWENQGEAIKESILEKYKYLKSSDYVLKNQNYYFKPSLSWSSISSGLGSFRFKPNGFLFDVGGMSLFTKENLLYLGGLLNSVVGKAFLDVINPTINFQKGDIAQIPIILDLTYKEEIDKLITENIEIVKDDWDSSELSWNFKRHPLVGNYSSLREAFLNFKKHTEENYNHLKENEEKLNKYFIKIYNLPELDYHVSDNIMSIKKADSEKLIQSFLSYFIGCLFGRYSLDKEGLVNTCKKLQSDNYRTFRPLDSAVIPLIPYQLVPDKNIGLKELFDKDIIDYLKDFLINIYGKESLEENLEFIAESISTRQGLSIEDEIRSYFFRNFSINHYSSYHRRPLFWEVRIGPGIELKFLLFYKRLDQEVIEEIKRNIPIFENYLDKEIAYYIVKRDQSKYANDKRSYSSKVEYYRKCINYLRDFKKKIEKLDLENLDLDLDDGIYKNYEKFQTDKDGNNLNILKKLSTLK